MLISHKPPTARGLEVLQLLADGLTQGETAAELGIGRHTVARRLEYLRNLYAPTNESLMALAVKLEWVRIEVRVAEWSS